MGGHVIVAAAAAQQVTIGESIGESISADISLSSPEGVNNTIVLLYFASLTTQNIRRNFREGNPAPQLDSVPVSSIQEIVASIGLAQAQLMRNVDEIKQLRQEVQQASSGTGRHNFPPSYLNPHPDFIFRIESLENDYDYPYEQLMKDFHQLLNGVALDWYCNNGAYLPFNHEVTLRMLS